MNTGCRFCASVAQRVENFCQTCGVPSPSYQANRSSRSCSLCGSALKSGSNFCSTCGIQNFRSTARRETPSQGDGTKAKLSPQAVEKPFQVSAPVVQPQTAKIEDVAEPKKRSKKLVPTLAIVSLGLIGGVIYQFTKDKRIPPAPVEMPSTAQDVSKSSTSFNANASAPQARTQQLPAPQTQLRTLGTSQVPGLRFNNIFAVRKYEDEAETISLTFVILNNSDVTLDVPELSVTVLAGETDYKSLRFSLQNPRLNSNTTTSITIQLPIDKPPPGVLTVKAEISKKAETGAQAGPSFDCSAARTSVEKMICGSLSLSSADRDLAFLYVNVRALSADLDALKAEQNQWIRDRNRCDTEACISDKYKSRTMQLQTKILER